MDRVRRLEEKRLAAALSGDVDALRNLFHPELVYTHTYGERDDYDSMLTKIADGVFEYRSIEHVEERISVVGDTAIIVGSQRAEIVVGGAIRHIHNATLAVWVGAGEDWRLIAFEPTPLPAR